MTQAALVSLAILKVNWDDVDQRDYVENYVPFAVECVRLLSSLSVHLEQIQERMLQEFGLRLPRNALSTILNRSVKRRYLLKVDGRYALNSPVADKVDLGETRRRVLDQHTLLTRELVAFCQERFGITWSEHDAENALHAFIHERSADLLEATIGGKAIAKPTSSPQGADYIVAAFVTYVIESKRESLAYLETIVKGSALADVLMYPDIADAGRKFRNLEVYFDTPFLLRAIGANAQDMEVACKELLKLLWDLNAELRCFQHTYEEMMGILEFGSLALQRSTSPSRLWGALRNLEERGYTASDLDLLMARLPQLLGALRIKIVPRPKHIERLTVDEIALRQKIEEQVQYYGSTDEALLRDIDSLTSVHTLRGGTNYYRLEDAKAAFVTTNRDLVVASRVFFRHAGTVPHSFTDEEMTTLTWLKRPKEMPDLPWKRVIADCYAALQPSEGMWARYRAEAARLRERGTVSDEDYQLLLDATETRAVLMEVTGSTGHAVNQESVTEVLRRVREKIRSEVLGEVQPVMNAEIQSRLEAERRASAAEEARRVAERSAGEIERSRIAEKAALRTRLQTISNTIASWLSGIIVVVVVVLLGFAIYLTLPYGWKGFLAPTVATVLLGGLSVLSFLNLSLGVNLRSMFRTMQSRLSSFFEDVLLGIIGSQQEDSSH